MITINEVPKKLAKLRAKYENKINTLSVKELNAQLKELDKVRSMICNQISERQIAELIGELKVNNYYTDASGFKEVSFYKITAIKDGNLTFIELNSEAIIKSSSSIAYTRNWSKITKEQFDSALKAFLEDLQCPNLKNNTNSNWDRVVEAILNSINKEK